MNQLETTQGDKVAMLQSIAGQFKGTDCGSQSARLLEALSRYPLNTFEASRYLDVYHPAARILQLRKQGHRISTHWQTVVTEIGRKHRVGLYVLEAGGAQ